MITTLSSTHGYRFRKISFFYMQIIVKYQVKLRKCFAPYIRSKTPKDFQGSKRHFNGEKETKWIARAATIFIKRASQQSPRCARSVITRGVRRHPYNLAPSLPPRAAPRCRLHKYTGFIKRRCCYEMSSEETQY